MLTAITVTLVLNPNHNTNLNRGELMYAIVVFFRGGAGARGQMSGLVCTYIRLCQVDDTRCGNLPPKTDIMPIALFNFNSKICMWKIIIVVDLLSQRTAKTE